MHIDIGGYMDQQKLLQMRKLRGYEIAQKGNIEQRDGVWIVPSQNTRNKEYQVTLKLDKNTCTCEDFKERGMNCKHIFAVDITITKQLNADGSTTTTTTKRITYPQVWPAYDKAQTQQKELFMKLMSDLVKNIPESDAPKKAGRPELSKRDMIFGSALKVFTTFSLRRFMTDAKDAHEKGYLKHIPHFTLVSVYMRRKELTPILQDLITLSSLPLKSVETKFAVDSSGFRTTLFTEYCNEKHKMHRHHNWLKAHICTGVTTNVITAVNVSDGHGSDLMEFRPLTSQTLENGFVMKEVSADKAYLSADNMSHVVRAGGMPFIPFKSDTIVPTKEKPYVWKKMWAYFTFNRDEFMEHYHARSNVESTFFMMKAKFTDLIRSKDETAQIIDFR